MTTFKTIDDFDSEEEYDNYILASLLCGVNQCVDVELAHELLSHEVDRLIKNQIPFTASEAYRIGKKILNASVDSSRDLH